MKIKSTITFKLESPEGDAIITAKKLPMNVRYELAAKLNSEEKAELGAAYKLYVQTVLGNILDISGLEHEDGSAVTVEDVQAMRIDGDLGDMIVTGYSVATAPKEVDPEKKDSSPDVVND